jgi:hypothetical protein
MIFAAVGISPLSVLLFVIGERFFAKRPVIVTYAPCPGFSLIDGYFIAVKNDARGNINNTNLKLLY